jgi:hypothetical protein
MTTTSNAILDRFGKAMFTCSDCGAALTLDDFFELALRFPDSGESQDDYFAAELLDGISHADCSLARASQSA